MDFSHLVHTAGEVKNPLSDGRLSGIDVGDDPDVACSSELRI
jgi:hypothetical protein